MNDIIGNFLRDVLYLAMIAGISMLIRYGLPWAGKAVKIYVIDRLVAAAEQKIKGSGMGAEKKVDVISQLDALHIKVDDFVDDMIEAAVYKLNQRQKEIEAAGRINTSAG